MNGWSAVVLAACLVCVTSGAAVRSNSISSAPSVTRLVRDVLARTTSTSEVLTLNLTNLVILFVIKAIIIVGGMFLFGGTGFNFFSGAGGLGRSSDGGSWLDNEDMLLMLTYLRGSTDNDFDCLNRVACEKPDKTREYIAAAKMIISGAKLADGLMSVDRKYEKVVRGMQTAVLHGQTGGVCSLRYSCHTQ